MVMFWPGPILRECLACGGQPPGQYLDDAQGRVDHQAEAGHAPKAGRSLCPVAAVGQ
jgi:hypothetical protein